MLFFKKEDIIKNFLMREVIDVDKKVLLLYLVGKVIVFFCINIDVLKSNG